MVSGAQGNRHKMCVPKILIGRRKDRLASVRLYVMHDVLERIEQNERIVDIVEQGTSVSYKEPSTTTNANATCRMPSLIYRPLPSHLNERIVERAYLINHRPKQMLKQHVGCNH